MHRKTKIVCDPGIRFGKPCINGTRIAVSDILNLVAAGYAIEDIPTQYDGITKADVFAALDWASKFIETPTAHILSGSR
ncbi:MAG: DUF433 domain-containing protein [Candidatus Omnitrophica bacterium]|nr:DUF433 domain-containing protein [Candidatus Omnitrophota bacterium]